MYRAKQLIYGVGTYQIGSQLYVGGRHYYNSFVDEKTIKERLGIFRGEKEGEEWAIVTGASEGIGA